MLGVPLLAQDHSAAATSADIRLIQAEADLLDESLATLPDDDPRAAEFRRRDDGLRDQVQQMADRVRSGRGEERPGVSKAEVDSLRRDIVALRTDVEATRGTGQAIADMRVPDGTEIRIRLQDGLSSRSARPEERVEARVSESVRVDGRLAIPAGSTVRGYVQSVEPAHRPAHGGRLDLAFDSLELDDGRRTSLKARVVSIEEDKLDKSKAGLGALVGGVLGALVDGGKGAVVGALVGGTGAVVATRGDDVELPAGTHLTLRLEHPVQVSRR